MKNYRETLVDLSEKVMTLNEKISDTLERIDTIRIDMIQARAIETKEKVQTSPNGEVFSESLSRIKDLELELDKQISNLADVKDTITYIASLTQNETLQNVLVLRHAELMSNVQISEIMKVTDRAIKKRAKKAYEILNTISSGEK